MKIVAPSTKLIQVYVLLTCAFVNATDFALGPSE